MKTATLTTSRNALYLFFSIILSVTPIYSQDYSDYSFHIKKGEIDKALQVLYQLSETLQPEHEDYYNVISGIMENETDVGKIGTIIEKKALLVPDRVKRSDLLRRAAIIMQVSGDIENAERYYEAAFGLNPAEQNIYMLLEAAVLNLESGNIEKGLSLAEFAGEKTQKEQSRNKSAIIKAYIFMLENKSEEASLLLENLLKNKNTDGEILFSVYKLSKWFNLVTLQKNTEKAIAEKISPAALREIDLYQDPVSPLYLFNNYSRTELPAGSVYAYIQTGAFTSLEYAGKSVEKAKMAGLSPEIREDSKDGKKLFRVLIPVYSEKEAETINIKLKENNIESFMIFK